MCGCVYYACIRIHNRLVVTIDNRLWFDNRLWPLVLSGLITVSGLIGSGLIIVDSLIFVCGILINQYSFIGKPWHIIHYDLYIQIITNWWNTYLKIYFALRLNTFGRFNVFMLSVTRMQKQKCDSGFWTQAILFIGQHVT